MSRQQGRREERLWHRRVKVPVPVERVVALLEGGWEEDCVFCGHRHLVVGPITPGGVWSTMLCPDCDGCVLCFVCHPDESLDDVCNCPSIT
jgi:hypothetical protein